MKPLNKWAEDHSLLPPTNRITQSSIQPAGVSAVELIHLVIIILVGTQAAVCMYIRREECEGFSGRWRQGKFYEGVICLLGQLAR